MPLELLIPVIVVAVTFVVYCWYDLAKARSTRYLPKGVWAIICVITIPLGGLAYLLFGRPHDA